MARYFELLYYLMSTVAWIAGAFYYGVRGRSMRMWLLMVLGVLSAIQSVYTIRILLGVIG